jgi:hypothetical protein
MNKLVVLLFVGCVALFSCKKETDNNVTPTQNNPVIPPPPPALPVNLPTVTIEITKLPRSSADYDIVNATISITEHDTLRIDKIKVSFASNENGSNFVIGRTTTKESTFDPHKNYSFTNEPLYRTDRSYYMFTVSLTFKNGSAMDFDTLYTLK